MFDLAHDFRASVRSFLRRPGYPLVAVGILALGLSASLAVFTYVRAFYQPFPGVDHDGLVSVFGVEDEEAYLNLSYLDFVDYAEAASGTDGAPFEGIAAAQPYYAASVRLATETQVAFLEAVSGEYFSVLGIETVAGRGLRPGDDRPGTDPAAVISHEWWQSSFGGDASVLGETIYLNYRPYTVVGVAAPDYLGVTSSARPDVWIPFAPFRDRYTRWSQQAEDRDIPLVQVYGRLAGGTSPTRAQAALASAAAGLDDAYPRDSPRQLRLAEATWIGPSTRLEEWSTVRVMTGVAGGLLLLVCANVANLLLSVASRRRRETAVRAALGAPPARLVRQVLVENVMLSTGAGVIALLLASPLSHRIGAYFARPSVWGANIARETSVDVSVVVFALLVSFATGVVAGVLPASRVWRRDLLTALRTSGDSSIGLPTRLFGHRVPSLRDLLVSAQVALAVVLMVVAGLVLRSLVAAGELDPGFTYDPLVVGTISTSSTDLKPEERAGFLRDMARELGTEPWVRSATVADRPLISFHSSADLLVGDSDQPVTTLFSRVMPGFFDALGIELLRGRALDPVVDWEGGRDVALVNEALARRYFGDQNPLGRRVDWPAEERSFEIVGLVRDTKTSDYFAEPPPTVYFSYPQHQNSTTATLLVSVEGDPPLAVPRLRQWLRNHESYLAIIHIVPYRDVVSGYLYTHRMNAEMFSVVAGLGLTLSVVGIFSVVSLAVGRRRREIAVRMAIGAERADISRLVISRALVSVGLGLATGLAMSYLASGLVGSLLFGVEPTDPLTLAAGSAALVLSALAAAYLPARRAATVDPTVSLRAE